MGIPAALKLKSVGSLAGIVIPGKNKARLMPALQHAGFESDDIYVVNKESLGDDISSTIKLSGADAIITITFPWKIPATVLNILPERCFNIHPGALPKYRGADPIFWQIKNREATVTITIHSMTNELDKGAIVLQANVPLLNEETYGMLVQKIAWFIADMVQKLTEAIYTNNIRFVEQEENGSTAYYNKPGWKDLLISWKDQDASEIMALVNAANPRYNGAITNIDGKQLNILEVSVVTLNNAPENAVPGQVVYADNIYGPIVSCINKEFLKINTVCMEEGFLSGVKLLGFGVVSGKQLL